MWLRVTCPNGHSLKIDTRYIGRKNRCPKCQAHIAMWLEVVCAGCGQSLKVKSKHAGKTGKCPNCQSLVQVPDISETVAMDILSDSASPAEQKPKPSAADVDTEAGLGSSSGVFSGSSHLSKLRECPNCGAQVTLAYRTCPKCNKYIGETDESDSVLAKVRRCAECNAVGFPGDEFCKNCGTPFA